MKQLVFISIALCLLASCAAPRRSATTAVPAASASKDESPRFLENISINPTAEGSSFVKKPLSIDKDNTALAFNYSADIERCNLLQFKYGILMNQAVEEMLDEKLIRFLDEWYGSPYRYGGNTKKGIDCSAFTCEMMTTVYGVSLPRTSLDQYKLSERIMKRSLRQGDLVFFNTRGKVSHVGIYLGNNKFAHASTSSGVMISDLDEDYFSKRYAGAGRIK